MRTSRKVMTRLSFCLMIFSWAIGSLSSAIDAKVTIRHFKQTNTIVEPKVIHQVLPDYPDELRKEGVEGKVKLQVTIDEKGEIQNIKVIQQLHPYLDFSAVQAVLQWKFEPAHKKKKPIPVITVLVVDFNPVIRQTEEKDSKTQSGFSQGGLLQEDSKRILAQSAIYCKKLANSALDFICLETITDTHYNFYTELNKNEDSIDRQTKTDSGDIVRVVSARPKHSWNSFKIEKIRYICDYQLIKKGNNIIQRRFIINGKRRDSENSKELFEEKRFSSFIPLLAPVRLLETERQNMFRYKIIVGEKIKGIEAYVIEILPKPGGAGGIKYAKIWINKATYQIIKSEIKGFPLEGYEDVFEEVIRINIIPEFTLTTYFQVEKEGVLFPSHTSILIDYPGLGIRSTSLKYKTEMTYKKYKFFTVETDHEVIKKISDDFFFQVYE